MKNKENKKLLKIIIITVIVGVFILFVLVSLGKKPQPITQQYLNQPRIQNDQLKTHISQDLKISFQYPKDWYVDDRYRSILLTNYVTNLNRDDHPNLNQIEIIIDETSLCQDSIEKNLIYGGCGENQKILNKILNKQTQNLSAGIFSKYTVQYPNNSQNTIYYLQKDDQVLQISKQPDPSRFEKEFEELVNSIEFL
ncbi:MAG: PsbP-related protein [Patescibacteria group bacterium]